MLIIVIPGLFNIFIMTGSQQKRIAHGIIFVKDIFREKEFVINNISLMEGKNGAFVAMPSYKTKKFDENGNPEYIDIVRRLQVLADKKQAYAEYREVRDEMKTLTRAKHTVDEFLNRDEKEKSLKR